MRWCLCVLVGVFLSAPEAWSFTGCVPVSKDAGKCEDGIAKAVGKLVAAVVKCHAKQADAAFKNAPLDDEACETSGTKSASGKFDAAVAKLSTCPPEAIATANGIEAALLAGPQSLDVRNAVFYCDATSGTPIDAGDDTGFVPATKDALKCADGVGKSFGKLWGALTKCTTKAADSGLAGKPFDENTCRTAALGKYDAASTKLLGGQCPSCLDAPGQQGIRDGVTTSMAGIEAQVFTCPAPTTTSTSVSSTTSTSNSSTTTTSTTHATTSTSTSTSHTTTTTSSTTSTSTSSTTSTTSTTIPLTACPAGGKVDVVATLVPDQNTFNSGFVAGIEVDLTYPSTVSMPGTGFIPVTDPSLPTTLIALLTSVPGGPDLYDGLQSFFDADTTPPFTLKVLDNLNDTAHVLFNVVFPFERARFTCTAGAALTAANFGCTIVSENDFLGRSIPANQRPVCQLTLSNPS